MAQFQLLNRGERGINQILSFAGALGNHRTAAKYFRTQQSPKDTALTAPGEGIRQIICKAVLLSSCIPFFLKPDVVQMPGVGDTVLCRQNSVISRSMLFRSKIGIFRIAAFPGRGFILAAFGTHLYKDIPGNIVIPVLLKTKPAEGISILQRGRRFPCLG